MSDGFDILGAEVTRDFVANLDDDDLLALVRQQGGALGNVLLDRILQLEGRMDEALSVWSKSPGVGQGGVADEMARVLSTSHLHLQGKEKR